VRPPQKVAPPACSMQGDPRRVSLQESGIGVERLSDNPPSEARIVAECEDCARLSSADLG
jgi:hypothetical protein